jgi:hypothetical protein
MICIAPDCSRFTEGLDHVCCIYCHVILQGGKPEGTHTVPCTIRMAEDPALHTTDEEELPF